jgi:hypothetical protein
VVDERGTELARFENPTWERHVLIKDVPRTVNLDVYDYDGDGISEIAMGHNFETVPDIEHRQCPHPQQRARPAAALDGAGAPRVSFPMAVLRLPRH